MASLEKVLDYRHRIDVTKQEISRTAGKLDVLKDKLRHGYGCDSITKGQQALKVLIEQSNKLQSLAEKKLRTFEQKWGKVLES